MIGYAAVMAKKIKIGLLGQILLALVLGATLGGVLPDWLTRVFVTYSDLFAQFLLFLIPLIILGLVAPAISELGRNAGRLLLLTTALAYGATLIAGFTSYFVADWTFPSLLHPSLDMQLEDKSMGSTPYFKLEIKPIMDVMSALVLAFMLGVGMTVLRTHALSDMFRDFRTIVGRTIAKAILPFLPLYIFGIVVRMAQSDRILDVLSTFLSIIGVIFAVHVFILLFQYAVAGWVTKRNPFKMLWTMMPAYFTALGTQSSAATIPVTLRQTISNGVPHDVAGFVVPLCATIHLSGSTLKIVACAMALLMMQGHEPGMMQMCGFILMLGVVMIAAPGVPGGAIMAALGVLQSLLGFGEAEQALMIALYIAMDNFGTACNVTGDGALAVIVNRFHKHDRPMPVPVPRPH